MGMTAPAFIATPARQEHNCNAWGQNDTVRCSAEREGARESEGDMFDPQQEITIRRAHENYHSFGGEMPEEPTPVGGTANPEDTSYPREAYKHYGNRITCDACGHKCLNG